MAGLTMRPSNWLTTIKEHWGEVKIGVNRAGLLKIHNYYF